MKRMYCMFDTVLAEATAPIIARNDGEALRAFKKALEGMAYGQDQKLYYVGDFYEDAPYVTGSATKAYEVKDSVENAQDQANAKSI